ncbi:unnamed protein product, partial [Urochloa humidicola]
YGDGEPTDNGHAVHDAQHPCRANVAVRRELHTPASDHSCTHVEFDIAGSGLTQIGWFTTRWWFSCSSIPLPSH